MPSATCLARNKNGLDQCGRLASSRGAVCSRSHSDYKPCRGGCGFYWNPDTYCPQCHMKELDDLRDEITRLEQQLQEDSSDGDQVEIARLGRSLALAQSKIKGLLQKHESGETREMQELREELARAQQQLQESQQEGEKIKNQLRRAQQQLRSMEEEEQDDDELTRTREQLRQAQQQLRSIERLEQHYRGQEEGLKEKLATARQQLQSTQEESQRFQNQLQIARKESQRLRSMQQEEGLREELATTQQQLEESQQEGEKIKNQLRQMNEDADELTRTREQLRAAKSESERFMQHYRGQEEGLNEELARAHYQLQVAQEESHRIQQELRSVREADKELKQRLQDEIRSLHEERQGDQQQLRLSRQEIQRLRSIQGGSKSQEEEELNEELATVRQHLQATQERTQSIEALLRDEINRHAAECHRLKKELQDKDSQLAKAHEKSRHVNHTTPMKILTFEEYFLPQIPTLLKS